MSALRPKQPDFDLVARPYRWLEYLTFGRTLERCRFYSLPRLIESKNALILGDGDGRFIARLLAANPSLHAHAVDSSGAMLELLRRRCKAQVPNAGKRLRCHQMDAMVFAEDTCQFKAKYDLIVTNFFLDCLDQESTNLLAIAIAKRAAPEAIWIVSDFRFPSGAMRIPAFIVIKGLYLAFRVFTGLRVGALPDHVEALSKAGFTRETTQFFLGDLLFSESWRWNEADQSQTERL